MRHVYHNNIPCITDNPLNSSISNKNPFEFINDTRNEIQFEYKSKPH